MDLWGKARSLAEEAAKRSSEITMEAAKRSAEITMEAARRSQELGRISSDFVSETAKKSKEFAAEASRRADLAKIAGQIKTLAEGIPPSIAAVAAASPLSDSSSAAADAGPDPAELEKFGVTEDLREFVKGITINTFKDFPMEDEPDMAEVTAVSNVRQDLTKWQARHATLVLSTVKEISKLRYELCPRHMKERKFWRVYFVLVDSHVASYEIRYNEEAKARAAEQEKLDRKSDIPKTGSTAKPETKDTNTKPKTSTSSAEQDLDVFLLGDLGSSDEGLDADDGDFDDDFDKIGSSSAPDSDNDAETKTNQ